MLTGKIRGSRQEKAPKCRQKKSPEPTAVQSFTPFRPYSRPMSPSQIFAAVVQYSEISNGLPTSVS